MMPYVSPSTYSLSRTMDTVELFTDGHSQAIRLPKEYQFEGNEVFIKKVGNLVILFPHHEPWQELLDSLSQFPDDFMVEREQPEQQVRKVQ